MSSGCLLAMILYKYALNALKSVFQFLQLPLAMLSGTGHYLGQDIVWDSLKKMPVSALIV